MSGAERETYGDEKRKVARRHLVFYLRVFDGMSNRVLGHLADISTRGAMLISDVPITENQEYRLRMRLPREIAGKDEILLQATSRWCKRDTNPDFYVSGFRIKGLDPDHEESIRQLVEDFSVEDTLETNNSDHPACNLTHTKGR